MSVTELQEQLGTSEEAGISIKESYPAGKTRERPHFLKFLGKEKESHALSAGPDGTRSKKVWRSWKKGVII